MEVRVRHGHELGPADFPLLQQVEGNLGSCSRVGQSVEPARGRVALLHDRALKRQVAQPVVLIQPLKHNRDLDLRGT